MVDISIDNCQLIFHDGNLYLRVKDSRRDYLLDEPIVLVRSINSLFLSKWNNNLPTLMTLYSIINQVSLISGKLRLNESPVILSGVICIPDTFESLSIVTREENLRKITGTEERVS